MIRVGRAPHRWRRALVLTGTLLGAAAAPAAAEWRVVPTAGLILGGSTTIYDPEEAAPRRKLALGSSFAFVSDRWLGAEVDASYVSGFFQQERGVRLVERSSVGTLMGNVIVAMPTDPARPGLRFFAVGGLGLLRARLDDVEGFLPVRSNMLGMNVGGGAEGFLTNRVGLRWDLRHFRELSRGSDPLGAGPTELRFWRASMGVVIKIGDVR